jgi:hypothetical protein
MTPRRHGRRLLLPKLQLAAFSPDENGQTGEDSFSKLIQLLFKDERRDEAVERPRSSIRGALSQL